MQNDCVNSSHYLQRATLPTYSSHWKKITFDGTYGYLSCLIFFDNATYENLLLY